VCQVAQNVLLDIAHNRIPVRKRRRPHRPRCATKAFKDLMSAKQPWDSLKYLVQTEPLEVKWLDIVGYEDLKQNLQTQLAEVVECYREERHLGINAKQQKTLSILLYGPVGTGKTQLAQAVVKEASKCLFIQWKLSDLLGKYRGESQKSIDLLFKMASDLGPSIIFMDECESLLARRSSDKVAG
jgi:SpoVK/Ycf46/Vps4 family AAA+-type ATPase